MEEFDSLKKVANGEQIKQQTPQFAFYEHTIGVASESHLVP